MRQMQIDTTVASTAKPQYVPSEAERNALWLSETSKTLSYVAVDPVLAVHYTYMLRYV
jgi:hypothetical protein